MATGERIKGSKVRIKLDLAGTGTYAAPCGLSSRSVTLSKGLEEFTLPDCDNPDAVPWQGRDATSLSMEVSGEGVLYAESVETWLEAFEAEDSVAAKVEIEFPSKTITWTGRMHLSSFALTGPSETQTVTASVTLQSDGQMVRAVA